MQSKETSKLETRKETWPEMNLAQNEDAPLNSTPGVKLGSDNDIQFAENDLPFESQRNLDDAWDDHRADSLPWRVHELCKDSRGSGMLTNIPVGQKLNSWIPYENCNYELGWSHWMPLGFYKFRYAVQKIFHKSVFRVFNIEITVGGLLFFAIIAALSIVGGYFSSVSQRAARTTGIIASIAGAVVFAFSGRNSIWIFLTGISYERMII